MKTALLLLVAFVMLVAAGCGGATITFHATGSSGYSAPPVYYPSVHRHRHYGEWTIYRYHYPGILVCNPYQGCTWR